MSERRPMHHGLRIAQLAMTFALLAAAGCGGGGDGGTAPASVPSIAGIAVTPSQATVIVGATVTLTATVDARNGASTAVLWRSGSQSIATVSAGVVNGVAPGTVTIEAVAAADTSKRAAATVTVVPPPPTVAGVTVTPSSLTLVEGATGTLTATVDARNGASTAVLWRSANQGVAQVAATGVVTAVSPGTASVEAIAVADTTKRASATVTVTPLPPAITSVSVTPTGGTLYLNRTVQLTPTVTRADPAVAVSYAWTATPAGRVSVSSTGLVTALTPGSVTVQVVATGSRPGFATAQRTASATLTIVAGPPPLTQWTKTRVLGNLDLVDVTAVLTSVGANIIYVGGSSTAFRTSETAAIWQTVDRGERWTKLFSITSGTVRHIVRAGSSLVVLSSTGGVWQSNGTPNWTVLRPPGGGTFFGLAVAGGSLVIVGANGAIERSVNGAPFQPMASGTTVTLNAVWGSADNALWAVGNSGLILRFDGTAWTPVPSGTFDNLRGIVERVPGDILAVGDNGRALRFNGSTWTSLPVATFDAPRVTSFAAVTTDGTSYYACSLGGRVARLDGTSWVTLPVPQVTGGISCSIHAPSPGTLVHGNEDALVQRFFNGTWTVANASPPFTSVVALSPTRVYVAMSYYKAILRYDGQQWLPFAQFDRNVRAIWAASPDALFVALDDGAVSRIVRLDASGAVTGEWTTPQQVLSLGGNAGTPWAVGMSGYAARFTSGTWVQVPTGTTETLFNVWSEPTAGPIAYLGGNNGVLRQFDGSAWQPVATGSTQSVRSIFGLSLAEAYAIVGRDVVRLDGTSVVPLTQTRLDFPGMGSGWATRQIYWMERDGRFSRWTNVEGRTEVGPSEPMSFGFDLAGITDAGFAIAVGRFSEVVIGAAPGFVPSGAIAARMLQTRPASTRALLDALNARASRAPR